MKQKNIFHIIIASGFGTGFSPFAPGTAGALLATVIWLVLAFLVSPYTLLFTTIGLIIVFTILGIWSANVLEKDWGKDPSRVVVDEMVGVWIPLLAVDAGHLYYALLAFVLFRLFDIYKPLGIRKMESLKGGVGVMMDDIVAGLYSLIILLVLKWVIG
ncbi:phosphatidylglycerophosphatase A [Dysgonomonas sp. PFB1-18]|uniref:phosphatidylglycerophosphatase A family protein n=1 Tax=unclassified Dysgonomonas TaxID=2630389 RepID=UPI002473BD9F|nr:MULTISPECIES: phosphatidylglycerophosphatase A [unclassified Dysgonomonas]MDH6307499.1 phosphatidylglycerophosphatase A [Dysgonomonas sp. PF1-14]MDH6337417.1 phosphatidylglycerophosphatase A [Dysgonomonas sp. PF1-16]MDH6379341.1 phosphatidylglycerophosphatase A [Dysgonomonas sp. PFB1-18]MDH6396021.1 phosphatidylglycerophosphatase A [Dysgonomonas sp. PF1-23]